MALFNRIKFSVNFTVIQIKIVIKAYYLYNNINNE